MTRLRVTTGRRPEPVERKFDLALGAISTPSQKSRLKLCVNVAASARSPKDGPAERSLRDIRKRDRGSGRTAPTTIVEVVAGELRIDIRSLGFTTFRERWNASSGSPRCASGFALKKTSFAARRSTAWRAHHVKE